MKLCIIALSLIVVVSGQRADYPDQPIPYSFNYVAPGDEGSSSHQETGDGNGRVQGSYELKDDDGRFRIVEYTADENGFRANIRTNEPGTANQNPADVTIESTAEFADGYSLSGVQPAPRPQVVRPQTPPPQVIRPQPQVIRPPPQVIRPPAPRPQPPATRPAAGGGTPGYVLVPVEDARRLNYNV